MLPRANEAILVPTQVNYVAKAANLYDAGYQLHGSVFVIEKQLGMTHIWDRVRVMGGAYGGFCSFDPVTGLFSYASYRCVFLPTLVQKVSPVTFSCTLTHHSLGTVWCKYQACFSWVWKG
jgi:hypothetical protein